jgi:hypothetical protein
MVTLKPKRPLQELATLTLKLKRPLQEPTRAILKLKQPLQDLAKRFFKQNSAKKLPKALFAVYSRVILPFPFFLFICPRVK